MSTCTECDEIYERENSVQEYCASRYVLDYEILSSTKNVYIHPSWLNGTVIDVGDLY